MPNYVLPLALGLIVGLLVRLLAPIIIAEVRKMFADAR